MTVRQLKCCVRLVPTPLRSSVPTVRPLLVMSVAILMWSSNLITGAVLADSVPAVMLSTLRQAICLVALLPVAIPGVREWWPALRAHWLLLTVMGLLALAIPHTAIYLALHTTQSVNVALMNSIVPMLVITLVWTLGRGGIGRAQAIGIVVSLAGAVVIIVRGEISGFLDLTFRPGDLLALLAALSISTYTVLYTSVRLPVPPLVFLAYGATVSTLMLLPLAALEALWIAPEPWRPTWSTGLAVVYLGIGPSAIAVACWNWGLAHLGAARGSQMVHLIPVSTALFAVAILGERLHTYHAIAFAAILVGIVLTNRWRPVSRAEDSAGIG